jgi:MFS family permease
MNFYLIVGTQRWAAVFRYDTGVIPERSSSSGSTSLSAGMQGVAVTRLAVRRGRFSRAVFPTGSVAAFISSPGSSSSPALRRRLAPEVTTLLVGRLLVGVGIGVASMLTPLYLAETAPARSRGALVSLNQLAITVGILVSYLIGYLFARHGEWRWMLALGAVPGVILSVGMLTLPETPRWLAGHGRMAEARAVLRRLRGHRGELGEAAHRLLREGASAELAELLSPAVRLPDHRGGPGDFSRSPASTR